jgi:hypothetical protein
MKIIYINSTKHGLREVLVDDEDYDELIKHKWSVIKSRNNYYATRFIHSSKFTMKMHRQVMNVTDPKILVDHKDHNGLNCQKSNMRVCTVSENCRNQRARKGSSSKYIGVHFYKPRSKWNAKISINGKIKHLGYFSNEEDAARARDEASKEHYGEFANLNFK